MSNIDKSSLAKTRELATLMVEQISMNPVSCKLLNEAWQKEFPDEVAIAKRMLALLDELEAAESRNERALELLSSADSENVWEIIGRLKVVISGDYRSEAETAAAAGKGE
ncbi:hypothetical protein AB6H35_05420 [Citrobacter freundii]|uniref:hypothetical protein n=1 Tax=Citrobacter freundii TaxID=546 RepID=UPI001CD3443C|nr:hypothetical protein [Citrobacter freundii]MDH1000969.1 hypothetical protein [Citrobacter freundii]WQO12319.1 hypothetical protein U0540_10170 [Citrobacter freundii]